MERKMNNIAEEIINYQKDHDIPDTLLAFKLHFSVEELHDIKSMEKSPNQDEVNIIKQTLA
ncbi:LBP_cg2779 family protein [Apilactobacillus quenuiae]|uniref:LBP_cg2779 family protein n=1 Tax=Apilactobacillus quenuiae TaxID=2008377 RepID=UPI000D01B663|nr:LBP_cg2779 family protein [Apilactobacillus quenuiae]